MAKMTDGELKALLDSAYLDAKAGGTLTADRSSALNYYEGDMSADMPSQEGRSSAVSMDTADTIEGMLPQLMEIFAGGDEVVRFNPVGPEDVQAAEQETDYVNHVFMNQNAGFLVLYSFIKDALLSKVGVVKVWWEEQEKEERETYYDQSEDAFAMIAASPDIEIVEHTARPERTHDVTVVKKTTYAHARVEGVPPEEFGIESNARSLRDCNYCFHNVSRTEAELIAQGYDKKQIKTLPSYEATGEEELSRDTVEESNSGDELNKAARKIQVVEHYVRMDYANEGKACLYRVVTGGSSGSSVVLKRDGKPDIEQFDFIPFAAMTPIIMTHRFFGRSIADLVKDIQQIKTALLRALLDNTYLANNPRVEVSEAHAGPMTIDDLLVSRPGGIVRTKQPGGLNWQITPAIGTHVYQMLEYADAMREVRTGVTKQGQGLDAGVLQNQSATAANQLFTVAQARIRLVARIFAETGVKDLFWLLHGLIRKHGQKAETVRLRNTWAQVDPRTWKNRADLTVTVGLGTGSKAEQIAHTQLLMGAQEKGIQAGLVSQKNLWNTARRLTKLLGEKDPEAYFVDPSKPPDQQDPTSAPIPAPPSPEMAKAESDKQQAAAALQLDGQKAQATIQVTREKHAADIQTSQKKMQADIQLEMARLEKDYTLKQQQMAAEIELKREQMAAEIALKREEMQINAEIKRATARQDNSVSDVRMGGETG